MRVSTVILTLNEERTLGRCLASLDWCDDVLVVDSGSTDRTAEVAAEHGARVIHRPFESFADQRNHALEQGGLRHDWVLHLDADEAATEALAAEMAALAPRDDLDGYLIAARTVMRGQWLRHAGMWPSYQVRLGHVGRLRFRQVGHGQQETVAPERLGRLSEPYLHFAFAHGFRSWLAKHLRYAADEADAIARQGRRGGAPRELLSRNPLASRRAAKAAADRLPPAVRPLLRFLHVYVWRRGFLDGRRGLVYALMLSVYEGMIAVLVYEKRLAGRDAMRMREAGRPGHPAEGRD